MTLSSAETVQERPLLSRKSKARLSDCGVVHEVCIVHRGRLPGFSPLTVDVNRNSEILLIMNGTCTYTHLFQSNVLFFDLQDVVDFLLLILVSQQLGVLTAQSLDLLLSILTLTEQQLLLRLVLLQLLLSTKTTQ